MAAVGPLIRLIITLGGASATLATDDWTDEEKNPVMMDMFSDTTQAATELYSMLGSGDEAKLLYDHTWLLTTAASFLMLLEQLNGFGHPNEGHQFNDGSSKFRAVDPLLWAAGPKITKWFDDGSKAYATRNEDQRKRAESLAAVDASMPAILINQKGHVMSARNMLSICKGGLIAAIPVALFLAKVPEIGIKLTYVFQLAIVGTTLGLSGQELRNLIEGGQDTANEIDKRIKEYDDLATAANDVVKELSGNTALKTAVPVAAESRASSAKGLMSSGPADTSTLASEGTSEDQPRLRDALGDDKTPADKDDKDATPAAPATPAATMPTLDQLSAMSGKFAKLSGQLAQPMNVFNQGMGQVQQLASMFQQGQGAAAPAEEDAEEDKLPEDAEGVGAAPGAEHAEGVPNEVVGVGAEQPREPGRYV